MTCSPPRALLATTAGLLALAASGCGGGGGGGDDGRASADELRASFAKVTGVRLDERETGQFTILHAADQGSYGRFGVFSIYVPHDDKTRKTLLRSGSADLRDVGHGVLLSAPGETDDRTRRLDVALKAALADDPSLVPAADRLCAQVGIDPAQGRPGTCRLGDKQLTVVDGTSELTTKVLKAKLTSATVAAQLPARSEYLDPKQAKGRYVVVRFALTNAMNTPISSIRTNLVVGDKTYAESPDSYSLTDYSEDPPFPLQPEATSTITTAYDVPPAAAAEALRAGQLELPAGSFEGSGSLSDEDAVGRIRLAGAPRLALRSAQAASSSSPSAPSTSSKADGREAAAEDALKEFYSALRKGNVRYVCRRLTRAAQQHFGGASACGAGRVINAAAKAKAPSTTVGLRFTTLLTSHETRALIIVRRARDGFSDMARLARQGDLWRIQGTRRLSQLR